MPFVQLRSLVGKTVVKDLLTAEIFKNAEEEVNVSTISFWG